MGAIEAPSLFMSDSDVVKMTGYKSPSKQIKWLKENHYYFEVSGLERPAVFINQGKNNVTQTNDFEMRFAS